MTDNNTSKKITELAKRRGFFTQTAESYGGVSGFYTFGPEGAELKRNIENLWRARFNNKEGHREIEAPTIMPEPVFKASGHLDGFDDMIVECPDCLESHRADHLVEDNTEIEEAEGFSTDKIEDLIAQHELICPACGAELSDIEVDEFNLMFKTNIGPGKSNPGYLRPETAQGIFTEFPRLRDYARNQLPFGITQIGKAYRNEISPRKSIIRVREFTQAELEHFIDPEEDSPNLDKVKDIEVTLYPISEQEKEEGEYITTTIKEAVDRDIIENKWVAYYLGVGKKWYEKIGIDMNRFRYRQHLEGERAHYAVDCWDAEAEIDGDWIEITGYAYRGCYDLKKHDQHSENDYKIFKEYDEPKKVEKKEINPDMSYLGPKYGDKAGKIVDKLENILKNEEKRLKSGSLDIEIEGERISIPSEKIGFNKVIKEEKGERILPHVVEPSFGVDRIVYTVIEHSYREDELEGEKRKSLSFNPQVAPTIAGVFPLVDKDGLDDKAKNLADKLRENGLSVTYDDSGTIGRRYRRQDEIGTPYCITIDHDTLEDNTVTIRDRDTTEQIRVGLDSLENILEKLKSGKKSFKELK